MDIFFILFLSCVSILFGVIITLVAQYYILLVYLKKSPVSDVPRKSKAEAYTLPEALKQELEKRVLDGSKETSSSLCISLMLQFLFHELRHSDSIKRWLYKKLSLEFDELLSKTTIGRFFDAVTIRDMNLGSQFPDIKNIKTEDVKLNKDEGHIDTLNIGLDVDYNGNFSLSVDAKMKFGKTAYLSIKVKRISGLARLQFTRYPYTHWSFSFYDDPILELAVESHFQGRQLQSNITNLILNQIKKAFKRKHTLPNYKIRYKPFFVKTDPGQLDLEDSEIVAQGRLSVTCCEVTRLAVTSGVTKTYYTVAVDSIPWIMLYPKGSDMCMVLELTVAKLRQTHLGVAFKQDGPGTVVVDTVTPNGVAAQAGFKPSDVLLAVENKSVASVQQVSKLMKTISNSNITFRIERVVDNYVMKCDATEKTEEMTSSNENACETEAEQDSFVIVENVKPETSEGTRKFKGFEKLRTPEKVPKLISGSENVSKIAQTIGNFTLRKRKTSVERSPLDSTKSTPTGTPQHTNLKLSSATEKKLPASEVPEIVRTDSESLDSEILTTFVEIFKGSEMTISSVLSFNKEYLFNLKEGYKYLNINVWGVRANEKDVLLGYANVPLAHVLYECCSSVLGHYIKRYSFLPPSNAPPTSQNHPLTTHSGFEQVFCYGDILLSFMWTHEGSVEIQQKSSTEQLSKPTAKFTPRHNFVRTQFQGTTHCDFCTKKIWLKDAVQCKECKLSCHKKCVAKCQTSTECIPPDKTNENDPNNDLQPDILRESWVDASDHGSGTLKRVNSVNSLMVPGSSGTSSQSLSLPPTPQRTPSRKQSLADINPFLLCPEVLEEVCKQSLEAPEGIQRLLSQVMLYPPDDSLMSVAKETGMQLYASVPHEEKVEKINLMVTELKKSLDAITMEHMELSRQMGLEESEVKKAKLAFLIGQADAKVHGLSVLMLHYCSGLQQMQEKIV